MDTAQRIRLGLLKASVNLYKLTLDAYPKDPDPKNWRTINGSKVHLTEGKIDGGAGGKFHGAAWTGKVPHEYTPAKKSKKAPSRSKAPSAEPVKPSTAGSVANMGEMLKIARKSPASSRHDAYQKFVHDSYDKSTPAEITEFFSKNPPRTLEKGEDFAKARKKYAKKRGDYLKSNGITDAQIKAFEQKLTELIQDSAYGMRIPAKYLNNCLADWFKNQFEAGHSGGKMDKQKRAMAESRLFENKDLIMTNGMPEFEREKNGLAIDSDPITGNNPPGTHYGSTIVRFKKDRLKGRVTYTLGDSLSIFNSDKAPAGDVENPSLAGTRIEPIDIKNVLSKDINDIKSFRKAIQGASCPYLELQYHGPLSMADVDSITFTEGKLPRQQVIKK